jgi:hypothetical protein
MPLTHNPYNSRTNPRTLMRRCARCEMEYPQCEYRKKGGRYFQTYCRFCSNEMAAYFRYKSKPWLFDKYLNREKHYTVLLLLPELGESESESWQGWVTAKSVREAISKAQAECMTLSGVKVDEPTDLKPVAVYYGHRKDLYDGA